MLQSELCSQSTNKPCHPVSACFKHLKTVEIHMPHVARKQNRPALWQVAAGEVGHRTSRNPSDFNERCLWGIGLHKKLKSNMNEWPNCYCVSWSRSLRCHPAHPIRGCFLKSLSRFCFYLKSGGKRSEPQNSELVNFESSMPFTRNVFYNPTRDWASHHSEKDTHVV